MTCIFEVAPFDGGWCVKICDTGEVMFFSSGGEAERQARKLATVYPGSAEVRVRDRWGRPVGFGAGDGPRSPPSPIEPATPGA